MKCKLLDTGLRSRPELGVLTPVDSEHGLPFCGFDGLLASGHRSKEQPRADAFAWRPCRVAPSLVCSTRASDVRGGQEAALKGRVSSEVRPRRLTDCAHVDRAQHSG